MFLGIEIGGTKLQLALGHGDGRLLSVVRRGVERDFGAVGIRAQIVEAYPELLAQAQAQPSDVTTCGIGFGGPVDSRRQRVLKSHQINGWDDFPLKEWAEETLKLPTIIANDADVAGFAEALHGAGAGCATVFYITVGSGIGGGLIVNRCIYPGAGRGAAEIGHLVAFHMADGSAVTVEDFASGWGIEKRAGRSVREVVALADGGDEASALILKTTVSVLAEAMVRVVTLLCPEVIVIGGGVSLIGERWFYEPLRREVDAKCFPSFRGLTRIMPAHLGEEVVLHGAIALAALENQP